MEEFKIKLLKLYEYNNSDISDSDYFTCDRTSDFEVIYNGDLYKVVNVESNTNLYRTGRTREENTYEVFLDGKKITDEDFVSKFIKVCETFKQTDEFKNIPYNEKIIPGYYYNNYEYVYNQDDYFSITLLNEGSYGCYDVERIDRCIYNNGTYSDIFKVIDGNNSFIIDINSSKYFKTRFYKGCKVLINGKVQDIKYQEIFTEDRLKDSIFSCYDKKYTHEYFDSLIKVIEFYKELNFDRRVVFNKSEIIGDEEIKVFCK